MSSVLLFGLFSSLKDRLGDSLSRDGSVCNPVHKSRKIHREFVRVVVLHEERALVYGVVSDNAARITKPLHIGGEVQAQNLRSQTVPLSAQVDAETLKGEAKHGAGTTGGAPDDGLSLLVRIANVVRHVFGRRDRRKFGPHKFPVNEEGEFSADTTGAGKRIVLVKELKALRAETPVLAQSSRSKERDVVVRL